MFFRDNKKREAKEFIDYFAKGDNWHNIDKKTGDWGYGAIHYSLIRILKPKKVLCIGSCWGFIPAVCAKACKDNATGVVDFIDAGYDEQDENYWGGVGWWKKCDPKKYFGKFGLEKNIDLWVMTSKEFVERNPSDTYGYIHIDGDHSYKGVKYDWETFWPKVEKGGFLAMHDIFSEDEYENVYGTRRLWQEIKDSGKFKLIELKGKYGVGIIQKI